MYFNKSKNKKTLEYVIKFQLLELLKHISDNENVDYNVLIERYLKDDTEKVVDDNGG